MFPAIGQNIHAGIAGEARPGGCATGFHQGHGGCDPSEAAAVKQGRHRLDGRGSCIPIPVHNSSVSINRGVPCSFPRASHTSSRGDVASWADILFFLRTVACYDGAPLLRPLCATLLRVEAGAFVDTTARARVVANSFPPVVRILPISSTIYGGLWVLGASIQAGSCVWYKLEALIEDAAARATERVATRKSRAPPTPDPQHRCLVIYHSSRAKRLVVRVMLVATRGCIYIASWLERIHASTKRRGTPSCW